MSYTVSARRKAENDIAKALAWYEKQQAGLALEFLSEFNDTVITLEADPLIYQELYRGVRRAVLRRFPYLIWYRVSGKTVSIIACTDARQNPVSTSKHLGV